MVPRFTEFYIPTLKILEDTKEHEIHQLIGEVADFCNLTEEDQKVMTKGGSQPRYFSNIQWAVTDLCQGGFITRTSRGVYKINFDGMLLLEEAPEHPNREYLAGKSDKFRDFMMRKNTRSVNVKSENDENTFSGEPQKEEETTSVDDDVALLGDLRHHRENAKRLGFNTVEIDERIDELEKKIMQSRIITSVQKAVQAFTSVPDVKCGLCFNLFSDNHTVYVTYDHEAFAALCGDSEQLVFENVEPEEDAADETLLDNSIIVKRRPSQPIKVLFEDGTMFERGNASAVFAQAIEHMGASSVAALGYKVNRMNLVGKERPERYNYQQIAGGYYVSTNLTNWRKKAMLEKIASRLGFKIVVRYSGDETD